MMKEISLEGKTALITGGATGIGYAIAGEMCDAGADVVIVGRREEKLREAAQNLGDHCRWYQFDVTQIEEYERLLNQIEEQGTIDILVNNAGINIKKDFFDFKAEEFDRIVETQAKAPFMLSQAVAERMKSRRSGNIIFGYVTTNS